MIRIMTCLLLVICLGCPVLAQSGAQNEKNQKMLEDAAKKGAPLQTNLSVRTNVQAQAVLIPRVDVNRIFGKEIANNYAVIQLIVGNKSSDAALIIHGIFIDYSRWALSGTLNEVPSASVDGMLRERAAQFQTASSPNHIASEEYRVVRGQLLDAQMWSKRNWTVRLLTLAGSLAGAYSFSLKEKGFLKGIAAFNGVFVPGVAQTWPDGTVDQLNRVSDFGFQANKVIPQHGSEIIVCFFPIDRFLTPGFRRLFLKSPALFFAPLQMLVDTTIANDVKAVLGENFGLGNGEKIDVKTLRESLPCYLYVDKQRRQGILEKPSSSADRKPEDEEPASEQSAKPLADIMSQVTDDSCLAHFGLKRDKDKITLIDGTDEIREESKKRLRSFIVLDYISQMSLNSVQVVVDGVMTVDTTAIAGKIDGIEFDKVSNCGGDQTLCFWTDLSAGSGTRSGTIRGSYLTGGSLKIAEAAALNITEVKTISEGSSDQVLHFSFKLTKPVASGTKLHFIVSKPLPGTVANAKDAKTKDSLEWEYVVGFPYSGPTINKVELDAKQSTVTVTGTGFIKDDVAVTLKTPDGKDVEVEAKNVEVKSGESIVVTLTDKALGCWSVGVKVRGMEAREFPPPPPNHKLGFLIVPAPTVTSATRNGGKIIVKGTDLNNAKDCDKQAILSFVFVKDGSEKEQELTVPDPKLNSPTEWTLELPDKAQGKKLSGKVKVRLNGKDVQGSPVQLK